MRILKKIFLIFCAVGILTDTFAMKAWAAPEVVPEIEIDEENL